MKSKESHYGKNVERKVEVIEVLKEVAIGKALEQDGLISEHTKWGGGELWDWVKKLMVVAFAHAVVFKANKVAWVMAYGME